MIINNLCILKAIQYSINDYNQKHSNEDDQIDSSFIYNLDNGSVVNIPDEILAKLKRISIVLTPEDMVDTNLQSFLQELSILLDNMNLELFSLELPVQKTDEYTHIDMSFLNHINKNIRYLELNSFDLSFYKSNLFNRFENLESLGLYNCIVSASMLISDINPKTIFGFEHKSIDRYINANSKSIQILLQNLNEDIILSTEELSFIARLLINRFMSLEDYLKFSKIFNLDNIPGLRIIIDDDFDLEGIDYEQLVNTLNSKKNITLITSITNLLKIDSQGMLKIPLSVKIQNASELSIEDLKKYKYITSVVNIDSPDVFVLSSLLDTYTREEYINIRKKIDEIISQIKMPKKDDPNREKKIFSQIYGILGEMIYYDNNAISEKEKYNRKLQATCRNLIGGLLHKTCVCSGFSVSLKQVLSCVGIYSELIIGYDEEDQSSHAWNIVRLDGKYYWTDLTWDADSIKAHRFPLLYCLKSTNDFQHSEMFNYDLPEDMIEEYNNLCSESISSEEQALLFECRKLEDSNVVYLSNFVAGVANSGMTSSDIAKTETEIKSALRNPPTIGIR